MKTVAVAELKAQLSSFIRQIKAGNEILITERGIAVAMLVPLGSKERRRTRRDRLVRAGLLRPGRGRVRKSLLSVPKGKMPGKSVLQALLEERNEGR